MNLSGHIDNKNRVILILGEGPTQGLDYIRLAVAAKYPINFKQSAKRFILNQHYNGNNSLLFVNVTKKYKLKAKYSEIKKYTLRLGNVSQNSTITNMEKQD